MKQRFPTNRLLRPTLDRAALGLVVLCPSLQTMPPPELESAARIVAAARDALGWGELVAAQDAVRVVGAARFLGTDAEQTLVFDARGRFVQHFEGPLRQSNGTDGKTTWLRDWTDTPQVLILGDRTSAELGTLFLTGGWTVAQELLAFELGERAGEELVLEFALTDGVLTGTIRLDASTHRARSVTFGSDDSPTTWTFADYRDHGGFFFPQRVELTQSGITQSFDTRAVERLSAVDDAAFTPRLEPPRDVRFDPEVGPDLEVKRVPTGHLLVHPRVDGEDLGWFIFDSGAGINCISTAETASLDGPFGEVGARGVGGTVPARFWRAGELTLGPMSVDQPIFMGLDLGFLEPHFGVEVGGILGFEFLSRCVVELDMVEASIALFDPAAYSLPDGGRWEEVLLYSRHPCVRAGFEDTEGIFKIDTGAANDTVTLHYQVVADLDLTGGRDTSASMAGGVGGQVGTRVGELATFRLGGHEFGAIRASFALEDKGAFSDDYVLGNIGGKLLEPFRLVFDYPDARVGFVPREAR
jgi:hypothetical protein